MSLNTAVKETASSLSSQLIKFVTAQSKIGFKIQTASTLPLEFSLSSIMTLALVMVPY